MMSIWLFPPFWVIAHDIAVNIPAHASWFTCSEDFRAAHSSARNCWVLKNTAHSYEWNYYDDVWLHRTAKLFFGVVVFHVLSRQHSIKWSCCSMASLSLDTIRVLNFCRSSVCQWCTLVVSIWAAISVFVGHLYFFCEMLFRSSSHFFLLGYLLYLLDFLELFVYSEDQLCWLYALYLLLVCGCLHFL